MLLITAIRNCPEHGWEGKIKPFDAWLRFGDQAEAETHRKTCDLPVVKCSCHDDNPS